MCMYVSEEWLKQIQLYIYKNFPFFSKAEVFLSFIYWLRNSCHQLPTAAAYLSRVGYTSTLSIQQCWIIKNAKGLQGRTLGFEQQASKARRPLGKQLRPLLLIWHQPWVLTSHVLVVVVQGQYISSNQYVQLLVLWWPQSQYTQYYRWHHSNDNFFENKEEERRNL